MTNRKIIFAINGSASRKASNKRLIEIFSEATKYDFDVTVFNGLKELPHFDPELSPVDTPKAITELRNNISSADGILICTPEYVFSLPSGLKNLMEWCVATTVFSGKCVGLITASASGEKAHEELQLIMKTLMAEFTHDTTLLIQGIKGKINEQGEITDDRTIQDLENFITAYKAQLEIT